MITERPQGEATNSRFTGSAHAVGGHLRREGALPDVTRELWSQQRASGPRISKAGPCALTQAAPPRKAALASTTTIRSSCPEIVLRSLILLIAVKNLLTRVALVAKDMRPDSGSLDEYIQAFDRRIQSVVDAHALLSQNSLGRRRPR